MGKIILLNTPIGNLGDLSYRVVEALKEGSLFAVEDTRIFKELLNHLGISLVGKKILSLHDQSTKEQLEKLILMAESENLFVTSEAGSPIVSDPAYPIVLAAYEKGIEVDSFSGISSPIMALELSGLPPIPFQFHGFVPRESGKRKKLFSEVCYGTHIFFEAPTRVEETLDELQKTRPDVELVVVRELSKKFQQVIRLKAGAWGEKKKEIVFKGEFIFLFHNKKIPKLASGDLPELAQEMLSKGASLKLLAKILSALLDRPSKEIYSELNRQKESR